MFTKYTLNSNVRLPVQVTNKNAAIAEDFCSRLGRYHMPFLWCGFNLERAIQGTDGMFLNPDIRNNGDNSLKDVSNNSSSLKSESDNFDSASMNSLPFSSGRYPSMDKKFNRLGSMSNTSSSERIDFSDNSRMKVNLNNFSTKKGMITRMFKQETDHLCEDDMCKYLFEINNKKNSTLKRLKIVPVLMLVEIEPAPYQDQPVLTPALRRVQPFKKVADASETGLYYPNSGRRCGYNI